MTSLAKSQENLNMLATAATQQLKQTNPLLSKMDADYYKANKAKKQEASSPTQGKPMPSNPQLKSQVRTSANTSALNVSATKRPTSVRKRGGGVKTNPVKPFEKPNRQGSGRRGNRPQARGGITFQKPQPSGSNKRAEISKRRSMMNFFLISLPNIII